ncbi:MAG: sodium:proton antiporter [Chloroflexi bacterium]|nr:sodium:proton antiporter [Chloroflexota bacterium]
MLNGLLLSTSSAILILLLVASVVGILAYRFTIPYTVALLLVGVGVGFSSVVRVVPFSPQLILVVFLPALLFEAALHLHADLLKRLWGPVLLLAVPGVFVTLTVVAVTVRLLLGLPWRSAIVFGAMVAPTDPIAVTAVFRRLGVSRHLSTVVEGESLFNDGVGLVAYSVALAVGTSAMPLALQVSGLFIWAVGGGLALGGLLGFLASRFVVHVDDHLVEVTISVVLAYGSYLLAGPLHFSGVMATLAAGLVFGTYGRAVGMGPRTQEALDTVWEYASFNINSLVFLLLGSALNVVGFEKHVWPLAAGILATIAGRALSVYGLGGLLAVLRRTVLPLRWRHLIFWAGLRGALSLAMALGLPSDFADRDLLITMVTGVVFLTIVLQGGSIAPLTRRLGVTTLHPSAEERVTALSPAER